MLALTLALILAADPTIATFAGTGQPGYSGDGAIASKAQLRDPFDVILDTDGNVYFSDTNNHCIRRVDAKTSVITTIAGNGKKGFSGDNGPATDATMNEPYGIERDRIGNLYIIDRLNACVRKVDVKTNMISTIAGVGGKKGFSGDKGPANTALLREPNGIALDLNEERLFIADVADQRIRVVDLKSGVIDTYCGTGKKVHDGDGGPFNEASLFGPRAIAFAPDGALFIVEREGHCVRRIDPATNKIELFAGTMKKGYTGDGKLATDATFNGPKELGIDAKGNLFIVDTENHAIRRIDAKTRIITTVAGDGKKGILDRPHGIAVGADGAVYIGDTLSHTIRVVK